MTNQKQRILLVDDERDIAKVLGKRLELAGFEVSTASDGEEAIAKVGEVRPELIILDVMLPKLNGYEVCAKIKQDEAHRKIPVVMFTAKGATQDHLAGLMFGANAYVSKACEFEVLLNQIRALLPQPAA